uniref:Uncharacterized protein n=1 Tax=Saimiri boliviensis boliviensis TaxID=39432 RepID=A0A2K6T1H8_SAIBB
MSFILCWGEVLTFYPVFIPILVARAMDVKNEHQSQKHACCLLKNGRRGDETLAWFSETHVTL